MIAACNAAFDRGVFLACRAACGVELPQRPFVRSVRLEESTRRASPTKDAVPAELGTIYVVRTHEQLGSYNRLCVYYGKLEPIEIDVTLGTFHFRHDTSPDCNNRSLVPPGTS